jgi:hypothetical protein
MISMPIPSVVKNRSTGAVAGCVEGAAAVARAHPQNVHAANINVRNRI